MEFTLTLEKINQYKEWAAGAVPYTEEEIDAIKFDEQIDMDRYAAYIGKKRLEEYGIPLTKKSDEHE